MIDPACGSGHFLLGAFARLLAKWEEQPAITDPWVLIRNVLDGLHGVDKNPFAVSIARFRLLIAAMKAGDVKHFADAPDFPLNIAVGDSLLHGRGGPGPAGKNSSATGDVHTYTTEDVDDYIKSVDILGVELLPRGRRQPALHHRQGQAGERELPARRTARSAPASTRSPSPSPSASSSSPTSPGPTAEAPAMSARSPLTRS